MYDNNRFGIFSTGKIKSAIPAEIAERGIPS